MPAGIFIFYLLSSVPSVDRSSSRFIYFSHIEYLRIPDNVGFGHRELYPLPYKHSLKRAGWFPNRLRDSWWLFRWKICQNWLDLIFTNDSGQRIIFDVLRLEDEMWGELEQIKQLKSLIWLIHLHYILMDTKRSLHKNGWNKNILLMVTLTLFYNSTAYCMERGSEQLPRLNPQVARCDHTGALYPEQKQDAFLNVRNRIMIKVGSANRTWWFATTDSSHSPQICSQK